ncbi:hypothetical protein QYF36_019767 [Acer negundo]|nr:hypothetical protein QYF36_019767 [Acer negundo]
MAAASLNLRYLFVVIFLNHFPTNAIFTYQNSANLSTSWQNNQNSSSYEFSDVKENATLELNGDGDLILTDFNNSRIWFTNSSRRNVARMYLSYFGNLRLDNATDNPRWQSFDNPANTWVPALAT